MSGDWYTLDVPHAISMEKRTIPVPAAVENGIAHWLAVPKEELDRAFRDSVRTIPPCYECGALYFVNEHGRIDIEHKRPSAKAREGFEARSLPKRVNPDWMSR